MPTRYHQQIHQADKVEESFALFRYRDLPFIETRGDNFVICVSDERAEKELA